MINSNNKRVVIIGAGLGGLSAGIYLLDNGYDVDIYEKNPVPGGECTGWYRKGTYIDGCAHWIVGTNPSSELFPLWEHIGAFGRETAIYSTEYITKFQLRDGRVFTFYAELKKLKKEMLDFFPEDKRMINKFIRSIKAYMHVHIPTKKPLDMLNFFELTAYGIRMLPMAFPYLKYKHISIEDYGHKFKNPELGEIIARFISDEHNIHSFIYVCQAVAQNDAGMVQGGSLNMMKRVAAHFKEKGGHLHLASPVEKVLVQNNKAQGIILESGVKVKADYVVAATDVRFMLDNLLEGKYPDPGFSKQFSNPKDNPLESSVMVSLRTTHNMDSLPKMYDFLTDDFEIFGEKQTHLAIRNFAFDKTLTTPKGTTLLTVLIPCKAYDYLASLDEKTYKEKKAKAGEKVKDEIVRRTGIPASELEVLDVTTPLTYNHYCNAYKGAYMAFGITARTKGLMRPGLIPNLQNFAFASQWIMPPGGLPVALLSGKHAAMRICMMDNRKFNCLEYKRIHKHKKRNFDLPNYLYYSK